MSFVLEHAYIIWNQMKHFRSYVLSFVTWVLSSFESLLLGDLSYALYSVNMSMLAVGNRYAFSSVCEWRDDNPIGWVAVWPGMVSSDTCVDLYLHHS